MFILYIAFIWLWVEHRLSTPRVTEYKSSERKDSNKTENPRINVTTRLCLETTDVVEKQYVLMFCVGVFLCVFCVCL